jgi:hypothetical protein
MATKKKKKKPAKKRAKKKGAKRGAVARKAPDTAHEKRLLDALHGFVRAAKMDAAKPPAKRAMKR